MEKNYEAPEALVVVFDEADLLDLSPEQNGNPERIQW